MIKQRGIVKLNEFRKNVSIDSGKFSLEEQMAERCSTKEEKTPKGNGISSSKWGGIDSNSNIRGVFVGCGNLHFYQQIRVTNCFLEQQV